MYLQMYQHLYILKRSQGWPGAIFQKFYALEPCLLVALGFVRKGAVVPENLFSTHHIEGNDPGAHDRYGQQEVVEYVAVHV